MLHVNINYPAGTIHIHQDPSCSRMMNQNKPSRRVSISKNNLDDQLRAFQNDKFPFSNTAPLNEDFHDFKAALTGCIPEFTAIEAASVDFNPSSPDEMIALLKTAYNKLSILKTKRKLVSNSKCLHMLFPDICAPMSGVNTLTYIYGNNNGSAKRYADVQRIMFSAMWRSGDFTEFLDDRWNQSFPKMFDNAILLLNKKSLKKT